MRQNIVEKGLKNIKFYSKIKILTKVILKLTVNVNDKGVCRLFVKRKVTKATPDETRHFRSG